MPKISEKIVFCTFRWRYSPLVIPGATPDIVLEKPALLQHLYAFTHGYSSGASGQVAQPVSLA